MKVTTEQRLRILACRSNREREELLAALDALELEGRELEHAQAYFGHREDAIEERIVRLERAEWQGTPAQRRTLDKELRRLMFGRWVRCSRCRARSPGVKPAGVDVVDPSWTRVRSADGTAAEAFLCPACAGELGMSAGIVDGDPTTIKLKLGARVVWPRAETPAETPWQRHVREARDQRLLGELEMATVAKLAIPSDASVMAIRQRLEVLGLFHFGHDGACRHCRHAIGPLVARLWNGGRPTMSELVAVVRMLEQHHPERLDPSRT